MNRLRQPSTDNPGGWRDLPVPGPWSRDGACRRADPDLFFPRRGEPVEPALAICRHCPVVEECRDYALAQGRSLVGIWGGLSAEQRDQIRIRRRVA